MKKIRMNCTATLDETFADFLLSRRAKGLAEKTLESYSSQWKAVARHLDTGTDIVTLQKADLDGGVVFYRHTKNRKAQVIPLCSPMIAILREYGRYRGGEPTDYLFCTETGTQLTENGLRQSVARYNTRRGVQKTSIHLFRHTFARKYLIDCGGDAFTLQKLLGHSTLAMTKHYCAIYDADLTKNYDNFSPLAQMKASGAKIKMPAKGR